MGAIITQLKTSPDGKEIGIFFTTMDGRAAMLPINLDSFSAAFPALQAIYNECCQKTDSGVILTNKGQPLEILDVSAPDSQTKAISFLCKNVDGNQVALSFSFEDALKLIPGLQIATQSEQRVGAPIPVQKITVTWDWPDKPEEHIMLHLTDENSIRFSFLLEMSTAVDLAKHLLFANQRHNEQGQGTAG